MYEPCIDVKGITIIAVRHSMRTRRDSDGIQAAPPIIDSGGLIISRKKGKVLTNISIVYARGIRYLEAP